MLVRRHPQYNQYNDYTEFGAFSNQKALKNLLKVTTKRNKVQDVHLFALVVCFDGCL
jgi:hypothetical protein